MNSADTVLRAAGRVLASLLAWPPARLLACSSKGPAHSSQLCLSFPIPSPALSKPTQSRCRCHERRCCLSSITAGHSLTVIQIRPVLAPSSPPPLSCAALPTAPLPSPCRCCTCCPAAMAAVGASWPCRRWPARADIVPALGAACPSALPLRSPATLAA